MSINYCTLNSSAVDSFCGNQRAKILARLLEEKYGPPVVENPHNGSGGVTNGRPTTGRNPTYQQYRQPDKWVPPIISTELDRIIVDVYVASEDFRGRAEQAVRPDNNIVVVTNIRVEGTTLGVNITNLRFNQASDAAA